jgi:hypothetical protein
MIRSAFPMGRLSKFSTVMALLATTLGMARADDSACRYTKPGLGWTYVLQSMRAKWEIGQPDRHYTRYLFCNDCASASTGVWGEFYLGKHLYGSTSVERAERRTEPFRNWVLRPNQLETRGIREGVTLGPLSGYAILYRYYLPHISEPDKPATVVRSLIVIDVKDDCVEFNIILASEPATDGNDWMPIDSFLSDVVVVKKSRDADLESPG